MTFNEKLQSIVDDVENHLQHGDEPISQEEIARLAGCSFNFFQRVFSYTNGLSFAQYVRFRKLTLAGYDLKSSDIKVVDLSYKYGYDSPTSFTKAFALFHGITPTEARRTKSTLRVYPKMQMDRKQHYTWHLEHRPFMRLIGVSTKISYKDDSRAQKIPAFWSECQQNGIFAKLIAMDTGEPKGLLGLFLNAPSSTGDAKYAMMVCYEAETPQGFTEIILPEADWAVFDCVGPVPGAIQKGWQYLTQEWIRKYPFKHADCPEFEWYSSGNAYAQNYLSQIWIPIMEEE